MNYFTDTFETAFGLFSVAVDADEAVVATAFGDIDALRRRLKSGELQPRAGAANLVREQIAEYCAGRRRTFSVPLAGHGTPFQRRVWSALTEIAFGVTRTYGELAAQLGSPSASRAVGRANATNPICLLVPCHRVIGSDGSLTGFAFGESLKRMLLEHEAAIVRSVSTAGFSPPPVLLRRAG
jgi:methylated-DNA-[protein]-cysteine S-methyltransferase